MRASISFVLLLLGFSSAPAATLERLTFDEMIEQSTLIVHGVAGESRAVRSGSLLYTETRLEVLEQWKGSPVNRIEVSLPGGTLGNLRQHFVGVPLLQRGRTYLAFLWQGSSGRVHIIGLSQGLLRIAQGEDGNLIAVRDPSAALALSQKDGLPLAISRISTPLSRLRAYVSSRVREGR